MELAHRSSAERARLALERGEHDPARFRASLLGVAPRSRDAWFDLVLGLEEHYDDGGELPRGCVPYIPCAVDTVVQAVDEAEISAADVFVDVGSGVGRVVTLVHLLSGATAVGLEIQSPLVRAARDLASKLRLSRVSYAHGDASQLLGSVPTTSVLFLYCPFSGERLTRLVDEVVEPLARARCLRICTVDLELPARAWISRVPSSSSACALYRCHQRSSTT